MHKGLDPMQDSRRQANFSQHKRRPSKSDALYSLCLLGLASSSAGLPFYIHFHPEKFGPPLMQFSGDLSRKIGESIGDEVYERRMSALLRPRLQFDQITTGSVPDVKRVKVLPLMQPFPESDDANRPILRLIYVGSNQVLLEENGKIALIRAGSKLSNGAAILSIVNHRGTWEVKTSSGEVYSWKSPQD